MHIKLKIQVTLSNTHMKTSISCHSFKPKFFFKFQEKYLYYLAQCSPSMSSTSLNQSDSLTSLGSMQSFATQDGQFFRYSKLSFYIFSNIFLDS